MTDQRPVVIFYVLLSFLLSSDELCDSQNSQHFGTLCFADLRHCFVIPPVFRQHVVSRARENLQVRSQNSGSLSLPSFSPSHTIPPPYVLGMRGRSPTLCCWVYVSRIITRRRMCQVQPQRTSMCFHLFHIYL